jgi:hypothetical protein
MRVLIEVMHIIAGLFAAMLIGALATWSYPLARQDIWSVTYVAMAAVMLMGIGPIRRAYRADRAAMNAAPEEEADG